MAKILVVEDEDDISLALKVLLRREGHATTHATNGLAGLRAAHEVHPELVLLDIGLPDLDGWSVLSRLRDVSDVPVLMLTAAGRDEDKVRGLRGGADDYLTKPFNNAELLARVDSLLRRASPADWGSGDLVHGDVVVSSARHCVTVAGDDVPVTPLELRLLTTLMRRQGQVLSPHQLLVAAWDDHSGVGTDRVKFAVLRLRRKLGWEDPTSSPLVAVRGFGYRLNPPR